MPLARGGTGETAFEMSFLGYLSGSRGVINNIFRRAGFVALDEAKICFGSPVTVGHSKVFSAIRLVQCPAHTHTRLIALPLFRMGEVASLMPMQHVSEKALDTTCLTRLD